MVLKNKNKDHFTDQGLLEAFKTGENSFYVGELFHRYVHLVYGTCLRWTKDRQLAQEASIGVLEQLIRWGSHVEIGDFKYWLNGVANNYCELFMAEKDTIGFLKEKIGDEAILNFSTEEGVPYSGKLLWTSCSKGKISTTIELDDEIVALLNGFYLHDKTFDELAKGTEKTADEVRISLRDSIRRIWLDLTDEQRVLLKPNSDKHKLVQWDTYLKYFMNELHGKERNQFERELISDPFEYSSFLGMIAFAGVSLDADLEILQRIIHRRTGYEKLPGRSSFNSKTTLSVVGGIIGMVILVVFVVYKLTKNNSDEDVPRRIIESAVDEGHDEPAPIFKSGDADSSFIDSLIADSIKKSEKTLDKQARQRRRRVTRDTIQPISSLSVKQVDLGLERDNSPVFVDLQTSSSEVFRLTEEPRVRFEPTKGIEGLQNSLKKEFENDNKYPKEGCKVEVIIDAEGKVVSVRILNLTDEELEEEIFNFIKKETRWEAVEGEVEDAKKYSQHIEF